MHFSQQIPVFVFLSLCLFNSVLSEGLFKIKESNININDIKSELNPEKFENLYKFKIKEIKEIKEIKPEPVRAEGIYELDFGDSYKFERYLKASGVSYIQRKLLTSEAQSTILVECNANNEYTIVKESPSKETVTKFKLYEQFVEKSNGRDCLSKVRKETCENGTWVQLINVQKCIVNGNMFVSKVKYTFTNEKELKVEYEAHSGESATRIYKKVN